MSARAAIFLDRDGVLNELVLDVASGRPESPYAAADVRLAPGAAEALRALADLGLPIVVVSNQPAVAKGTATPAQLREVHDEIERRLRDQHAGVDAWRYCFHHPEGLDSELGVLCECRKPAPGMLLAAARDMGIEDLSSSWMIGDSDVDVLAGRAAGCRTVLVEQSASSHRRHGAEPDARAADLGQAVDYLIAARTARR